MARQSKRASSDGIMAVEKLSYNLIVWWCVMEMQG